MAAELVSRYFNTDADPPPDYCTGDEGPVPPDEKEELRQRAVRALWLMLRVEALKKEPGLVSAMRALIREQRDDLMALADILDEES